MTNSTIPKKKQSDRLRWLITGGCGFIGTALISRLISEGGHTIRVLDNLSVGTREDLSGVCEFVEIKEEKVKSETRSTKSETNPKSECTNDQNSSRQCGFEHSNFENSNMPAPCNAKPISPGFRISSFDIRASNPKVQLLVGDITNPQACINSATDTDIIVHLAANTGVDPSVEDPRKDMEANVIGTFNMLEAARLNNVPRFVFASSGAPAGEVEPPIHEELAPHPVSPYGASKLAGEGYCSAYFRTFGVETVCLRFGNVYGPLSGKKDSVVAKFIKQALAGEPVEIYGDGTQTRDFIPVSDLVRAIRLAASTPDIGGETFQIATSREHTVNEVAELLKKELKSSLDVDMVITYGAPRQGDVKRNFSDTSKAMNRLNWRAEVDLNRGLHQTIEWFLSERYEPRCNLGGGAVPQRPPSTKSY